MSGEFPDELELSLRERLGAERRKVTVITSELEAARAERDEADRRAGAAERGSVSMRADLERLARCRDHQKEEAGYSLNVSFDVVWSETLAKAKDRDAAIAEADAAKAEVERLRSTLARHVLIVDSYGVPGSDFYICPFCEGESGAGVLNKGVRHEAGCILAGSQPENSEDTAEERRAALADSAEKGAA